MLRIRLLGGATIEREDGSVLTGRAVQRHRVAILALLATAPTGGLSRDRLLGLLWPDSDTDRARNLLNVAVYELRKALGDGTIVTAGDELRLDRALLTSDIAEFDTAVANGDHRAVATMYRGPLLDGFFLSDAPDFEKWLDGERSRVTAAVSRSLEALASDASQRGNLVESVEWWRQRAALDPLDARVALRLMEALEASGNRAGALQHARVHAKLLESELGLGPDGAVERYAATLTSLPTRNAAPPPPPQSIEAPPEAASTPSVDAALLAESAPAVVVADRPQRRRIGLLTGALTVLIASLLALVAWRRNADAHRDAPRSIAVLPFVNLGADAGDAYLGDGLTEELTARLSADSTLKVVSRTSSSRVQRAEQTVPEIAKALGVTTVLEGSVRREGKRVRVTAQLIDARDDRHLWAATYDREVSDVLALQEQLAREVTRALETALGQPAIGIAASRGTRDVEAHDLYLRGRWHWKRRNLEGHQLAIAYFGQAIARDSGYADAYAGLSDALFTAYVLGFEPWASNEVETVSAMRRASERAVALDPASTAAHTSLGVVRWAESDLAAAERELQRAIALAPGNPVARTWYGRLLQITGHPIEALNESREAWVREPFDLISIHNYAIDLMMADSVERASAMYRRVLELDSTFRLAQTGYSILQVHVGDTAPASARLIRMAQMPPSTTQLQVNLAWGLAMRGQRDSASRVLRAITQRVPSTGAPRIGFVMARAYVALGQKDSAFAWLERADWRWPPWGDLHARELESLWTDPRYAALSRRVGRALHADQTKYGWVEVPSPAMAKQLTTRVAARTKH